MVTAPLRRLHNRYEEGETRFQTLLRMMDSRTYPTPHDPKRKMRGSKDTKDEAENKQNSNLQVKTEEEERENQVKPVDGTQNIASSAKKMHGNLCMNMDARLCNKGARHTRYLHETGDSQKRERVQVQVRRRYADL